MSTAKPDVLTRFRYEKAAERYLQSLPLEHFMEATAQGTQRKITLASLELVHAARPEVQFYNELLVQYPKPDGTIGQVVPDNMVIVHDAPLDPGGSFDTVFQPVKPFWVLEYVSKQSRRKDYDENMEKYEKILRIPYYLLFYPDNLELTLFKYRKHARRYTSVKPNGGGRHPIEELELEVALLDGWVRYWFRGKLLPLPGELQRELNETREQLVEATRRADDATRKVDEAVRRVDETVERLNSTIQRVESESRRADEAQRRADEFKREAEAERQARQALEEELARYRAKNGKS